jgi:uncharacterized oligopeptide transporter (OPT) family protein
VLVPLLTELNAVKTVDAAGRTERNSILPSQVKVFDWLPKVDGYPLSAWTVSLDLSLVLVAAGAIVGLRTTLSMLLGGLLVVLFIGPVALGAEWTNASGHLVSAVTRPGAAWKEIGLWFGAPLMVAYGLVAFALGFRTIGRALSNLRRAADAAADDPASGVEVPMAWFVVGTSVTGVLVVVLAWLAFDVPLHYGALAVFMTFFLALVACRATGDTDITPIGAMGKITQLTYGVLIPQNYAANLMTASITASASGESADLLNDLKSGYLLGAHPRRQFVAQFLGIFTGAVASVLCYFVVVPDATVLTGRAGSPPQFAAPSAQQWRAVAELFRVGIGNLHPLAREGIAIGLFAGTALAIVEWLFPKARRWLPSATGVGLGMILPVATSVSFVLGACLAWAFERVDKRQADRFVIPVASGLIAGESICGVLVAAVNNFILK